MRIEEQRSLIKGLRPWYSMMGKVLDPHLLERGSFLTEKKILADYKHEYFDQPLPENLLITEPTLFWYQPGRHKSQGEDKVEIAGVYLKNVIPQAIQDEALKGFQTMPWVDPHRAETETAIKQQRGYEPAKELFVGFTHRISIEKSDNAGPNFLHVGPLVQRMDHVFKTVLPAYWARQNKPNTRAERDKEAADKKKFPNEWGGILARFRQFGTSFSNVTMLKSCPASAHKDGNANKFVTNFACMTTVAGDPKKKFTGGTFCLLEYGVRIPVGPGDLLIAQTGREWHTNIGHVDGLKFSIVTYYKHNTSNVRFKNIGKSVGEETAEQKLLDYFMARSKNPEQIQKIWEKHRRKS